MGPNSTDSFAAPILLTESYHVIIPMAINTDPGRRYFHDLKIVSFLFIPKTTISSNIPPAIGMLVAANVIGGIPRNIVRDSIKIVSSERVNALAKTIQDLLDSLRL
jgi:hypothetical protein